jgi:Protein of unknown function (DUF642)
MRWTSVVAIALVVFTTDACGTSPPASPTGPPQDGSRVQQNLFGLARTDPPPAGSPTGVDLARCLLGSREAACYSPPKAASTTSDKIERVGALTAPLNLNALTVGNTVTLTWIAPPDPVVTYIIEAGSATGAADLANFSTGTTATSFIASGVGTGTYFVRVRAVTSAAISGPSNEVTVVVGGGPCVFGLPGAPVLTLTANTGGTVAFAWTTPPGNPVAYVLEAGSASGLANLANSTLGPVTTFGTTGVAPGTYYVRVRARNACGLGLASNEIQLIVSIVGMPELVLNGSFENPQVAARSFQVFDRLPGWTQSRGFRGIELQRGVAGSPFDGAQHVELDSFTPTGISQEIPTQPGRTYQLRFAFSPRPRTTAPDNILRVTWGGGQVAVLSSDGTALADTRWTVHTFTVTGGPGSTTTLAFEDLGVSNTLGTYLDAVSVVERSTPAITGPVLANSAGGLSTR